MVCNFRIIFEHVLNEMTDVNNKHGNKVEIISDSESENEVKTDRNLQSLEKPSLSGFDADKDG